jgi:hypothetical protein
MVGVPTPLEQVLALSTFFTKLPPLFRVRMRSVLRQNMLRARHAACFLRMNLARTDAAARRDTCDNGRFCPDKGGRLFALQCGTYIIFRRYWSFSQEKNFVTVFASATFCSRAVDTPGIAQDPDGRKATDTHAQFLSRVERHGRQGRQALAFLAPTWLAGLIA